MTSRRRPPRGWTEPPETIRHWHLDSEAARAVEMWFGGWVPEGARADGERSVLLPLAGGRWLKIKGAGLLGGRVDFGRRMRTGPKALWFDFEGRVVEDVGMGHDAAHPGGASFQQAAVEWRVSRRLAAAGERVLPCLGYGCIAEAGQTSWFSVFDWDPAFGTTRGWPGLPARDYLDRVRLSGETALRLAHRHGLIGYPWFLTDGHGGTVIKDLHPFRQADPVNMSQVTFVMLQIHALQINSASVRWTAERGPGGLPPDVHVLPFRAACPEATVRDHADLVDRIVLPYMLQPAQPFQGERLVRSLSANPISAALMGLVPPDYARFD